MFKPTKAKTPNEYIDMLEEPRKSQIEKIHKVIMDVAPDFKPFIISGMIGYGKMKYKTKAGKVGDWCVLALASQKNYISIYSCVVKNGEYIAEKNKKILGKASVGRSCIRYTKFEDIPWVELKKVLKESRDIAVVDGIFQS